MALPLAFKFIVIPFLLLNCVESIDQHPKEEGIWEWEEDLLEFPLNLEYLEAEFFLFGSTGFGLDKFAPGLTQNGSSPIGARKALLDPITNDIIYQFALQEIGHLKAIKKMVKGFPRPKLDLSSSKFGEAMNSAFGSPLIPPFDPYINSINYLLASYLIPYVGLTGYVGTSPKLMSRDAKTLVAGLLAVESGQDAVIRTMLYKRRFQMVSPYQITVQEFTNRISELRNKLGKSGLKDEGLFIDPSEGAEGKVTGNILVGDKYSMGYPRTPEEVLRIVYSTGDEHKIGGFYPNGAYGSIARKYLA
ncbi:ferritin-like catalase Nec2 [Amaranthus tricolor]|uniref:ferritin-like catalase Nec2 n=1 Tax=Amaranthus tricolor TaxID=29722 RepID=UPI002582A642|nr:ferritin-like catalase Nec2 [Amaranthus tricolor]